MKRKILLGILIVAVLAAAVVAYVWFYVYNKSHKDIEHAKPDFSLTAGGFIAEFEASDTTADRKFSDKTLELTGQVQEVITGDSISSVVLDEGKNLTITCEFLPKYNDVARNLTSGTSLRIKGLYVGYVFDPLLADFGEKGDIKLKKCSLVK